MKFRELSEEAKTRAIADYLSGWAETHHDDLCLLNDVRTILAESDAEYDDEGSFVGEAAEFFTTSDFSYSNRASEVQA